MNKKRISERRIVDVLVSYIKNTHLVERELPVYERRIDIAALCGITNELWTIEAKICNWNRALSQAIVNLAAGEKSYIAIYSKHTNSIDISLLDKHGIGLISVGSKWKDVKILKEARRSPFTNNLVTSRIKERMCA